MKGSEKENCGEGVHEENVCVLCKEKEGEGSTGIFYIESRYQFRFTLSQVEGGTIGLGEGRNVSYSSEWSCGDSKSDSLLRRVKDLK